MLQRIVNLSEAAEICGKSIPTIKDWAKKRGAGWVIERGDKRTPWKIDIAALVEWREKVAAREAKRGARRESGKNRPGFEDPILEKFPFLDDLHELPPAEAAVIASGLYTAGYTIENLLPNLASSLVLAGAPMKVVYASYRMMALVMVGFFTDMAKQIPELKHIDLDNDLKFEVPWGDDLDWSRTAKTAGEPVDIKAWEAHCAAMTKKYRLGPEHEHD